MSPGYDRVFKIKSRNILKRKFGGVWVYIDLPGVVIWQHIHPFTRYIHTEKMVDKIPASLE